jgi:vacuolar protein 8
MLSPNVEVQCNAVGCITNLATHEDNKAKIARSGALGPLTRLAKSRDMRVQRNATGALLNMTHSGMLSPNQWNQCRIVSDQAQTRTDSNL